MALGLMMGAMTLMNFNRPTTNAIDQNRACQFDLTRISGIIPIIGEACI
jgi:hypothetical protein